MRPLSEQVNRTIASMAPCPSKPQNSCLKLGMKERAGSFCFDCRYARDGNKPTTVRLISAQKMASKWAYIALSVESHVDSRSCEYLLQRFKTLTGKKWLEERAWRMRRVPGQSHWEGLSLRFQPARRKLARSESDVGYDAVVPSPGGWVGRREDVHNVVSVMPTECRGCARAVPWCTPGFESSFSPLPCACMLADTLAALACVHPQLHLALWHPGSWSNDSPSDIRLTPHRASACYERKLR